MKRTILFLLMIALIGCDYKDLENNPIPTVIKIRQGEFLTDNGTKMSLRCDTEQIYPCANYALASVNNFDGKRLSITFTEVVIGDICLTAPAPASSVIYLDTIPNGEYSIAINNGVLKNEGKLKINNTEVTLDFVAQRGISIANKVVKRIPANTYWGVIGYDVENEANKVNEFINDLKNLDGVVAVNQQTPGVYSYYMIDENGEMKFDDMGIGYWFSTGLIFQYSGDDRTKFEEDLQDLVAQYHIRVGLNTDSGKYIQNAN